MPFDLHPDGFLRLKHWSGLPWLVHGFSTRAAGDFSFTRNHGGFAHMDGLSCESVRQVHSDRLHVAESRPSQDHRPPPEADGLLSRQPGRVLSVRTADCLPLLVVDRKARSVAAVHAGWRGSVKSIALRAVEAMRREFESQPGDLEVAIGPGIGPCCYEVGPEVAAQFSPEVVVRPERPHLDLALENRRQLLSAGVSPAKIWIADLCTCCRDDQFFSYRREGERAGRMIAVVGIRRGAEGEAG